MKKELGRIGLSYGGGGSLCSDGDMDTKWTLGSGDLTRVGSMDREVEVEVDECDVQARVLKLYRDAIVPQRISELPTLTLPFIHRSRLIFMLTFTSLQIASCIRRILDVNRGAVKVFGRHASRS